MRILMIANYLPYPQNSGGRSRIYNLLRRVASKHEVSLAAFLESPEDAEGLSHLRQICAQVETTSFQQRSRLSKIPGLLSFALQGKPPELMLLHSEELVSKIRQLAATTKFDIVQIESVMGLYLDALPKTGHLKSIEMFQNITSQQYERVSSVEQHWPKKLRMWLNSVAMGSWEPRYANKFDRCTTVSEADRQLLLSANPNLTVDVIPNGVDLQKFRPLPPENTSTSLLFIGNLGYPPCSDAALYFCQEIFPHIQQQAETVEFWIVGRDPLPEVRALNSQFVHVTGAVEDVVPYYRQSAVCLVPLRAGGGTRLKILEAMALGRPVVSTTIGCEGLEVIAGEHLLIADTPKQFAEQTLRLLRDRQLAQALAANGRRLVETRYGWDQIAEKLAGIYAELAVSSETIGKGGLR